MDPGLKKKITDYFPGRKHTNVRESEKSVLLQKSEISEARSVYRKSDAAEDSRHRMFFCGFGVSDKNSEITYCVRHYGIWS